MGKLGEKQKREYSKGNQRFQRLVTIVCLFIFCFSLFKLTVIFIDYYKNRKVMADIQEIYSQDTVDQEMTNNNVVRNSFEPLFAINDDIEGWITIDNTMIDYPILQSSDNSYYLNRNYRHKKTRAGSIFMDFRNEIQASNKNTIIYGHRMKDGSMFGQLDKFLDQAFLNKNNHFYFDTLYESYDAEIFSVYLTTTDFYYIQTDFAGDEEYKSFIEEIKERSVVEADVDVTINDQILTLSTCDNWLTEGRLVVHAKLKVRS
ncbi:class B sortase [Lederbergia lenta]|uniref:class B sortase n=1 Tax=Lederbergia lenta TaxID=1467 RepID=UPI00203ADB42|nr:class B sortase [Lederbergia lenta]MCM3112708.1 class B sortase [Lederbergia lenta]